MFLSRGYHVLLPFFALAQVLTVSTAENVNVEDLAVSAKLSWLPMNLNLTNLATRSTDSTCMEDYEKWVAAIDRRSLWALRMLDASSKVQPGMMNGNLRELGMYDQCIGIRAEENSARIQGQHCLVSWNPLSALTRSTSSSRVSSPYDAMISENGRAMSTASIDVFYSSVCFPSSCNEEEVVELVNAVLEAQTVIDIGMTIQVYGATCAHLGSKDFTGGEIVTILFFSIIAVFMLVATGCDFWKRTKLVGVPGVVHTLARFSLYTNMMALLNMKIAPGTIPSINGIRFFSMCWVIIGHHYVFSLVKPIVNLGDIVSWSESWSSMHVLTAPFAVDSFFVISGFLLAHLFFKSMQSGGKYNLPMLMLHRYIRLTPALGALMLFCAVLLHRVGDGPTWDQSVVILTNPCQDNWWTNLLYVQNYVEAKRICLPHSWYLAVDMQLFWISPIVLYPLWKWPKVGVGILSFCLLVSVAVPTTLFAVYGYSTAFVRTNVSNLRRLSVLDNFVLAYIPTHNRACAYLIGIMLGRDITVRKRRPTKWNVAINWIVACLCFMYCIWSVRHVHLASYSYVPFWESFYTATARPLWSIALAWVIYASTNDHAGPISKFLSLPLFVPLSRMSYTIYLMHVVIQISKGSVARTPIFFSDFEYFNDFWGDLALTIVFAILLSLFFESPVIVLEKLLKNRHHLHVQQQSVFTPRPRTDAEGGIDNSAMIQEQ